MWLIGGIIASMATLSSGASVGVLFTGAIGMGIVKIIQGLNEWSKRTNTKPMSEGSNVMKPQGANFTDLTRSKKKGLNYKVNIYIGVTMICIGVVGAIICFSIGFYYIPIAILLMGLALVARGYWDKSKLENKTSSLRIDWNLTGKGPWGK